MALHFTPSMWTSEYLCDFYFSVFQIRTVIRNTAVRTLKPRCTHLKPWCIKGPIQSFGNNEIVCYHIWLNIYKCVLFLRLSHRHTKLAVFCNRTLHLHDNWQCDYENIPNICPQNLISVRTHIRTYTHLPSVNCPSCANSSAEKTDRQMDRLLYFYTSQWENRWDEGGEEERKK